MVIAPWIIYAFVAVFAALAIYSIYAARKAAKKQGTSASQMDSSISKEGTSFVDLAGSPHMYGNMVAFWGQTTKAIKKKSGKK